ncbi:hypothetical protein ORV05_04405 [Amycolatopsis cynarae]|uniref:ParB/Sulfiredoxin domain-containing protein n=1 Tax=Amycolatopsis cynarae TaxID=2995223 RepID=A0ABY7B3Z3_9PSEU|nr:hypothetical protein [Amycolatopsis sp. HUAS 11-8]WAL67039.1 hypothetical protein ORV05_04405 [Amycolatopsis sp. HUAS 11-8]
MERVTVSDGTGLIETGETQGKTLRIPALTESLRIALATGQLRRPLGETLGPLLRLLSSGHYELAGPEPLFDDRRLVATGGDWPRAEDGRVAYYRRAIRSGLRPVAVLLRPGGRARDLVLDGHHKIVAYQAERLAPSVVRIGVLSRGSGPTAPPGDGHHHPSAAR